MPGVPALVRLIVDQMRADRRAGLRTAAFVSGYPGSPLGGLDQELARNQALLDEHGIVHQPGVNEELAATAIYGSQVATVTDGCTQDGVLGVWYGKAPGLDRSADAIRHGNFAGTGPNSGVLALVGDDPSCKSSTLPSASEGMCAELLMPVIHPGTSQDILDLGRHAIALSRFSGLWTAVKVVTVVADGSSTVQLDSNRPAIRVPQTSRDRRHLVPALRYPHSVEMEREIHELRLPRAREYAVLNGLNRVTVDPSDAWLGIAAAGHTYLDVIEAFRLLGIDPHDLAGLGIRLFQVGMSFPLDTNQIRRFAAGLTEVMVVEEHRGFLEGAIRHALYGMTDAPTVTGKHDPDGAALVPGWGGLDADAIRGPLRRRLVTRIDPARLRTIPGAAPDRLALTVLPQRTPWFCSGCPHSTSTQVPDGALVGTGIGCHALAAKMDTARTGRILSNVQMGGEGAQWVGAAPFLNTGHMFQNLGDGTLMHSGWLAIRFAVSSASHITFKILYNSAVSMTGGQHPPGLRSVPELVSGLRAEGVGRIIITTDDTTKYRRITFGARVEVWDRHRILDAQRALAAEPGVTVLIHDQECSAELRRKRKRGLAPRPQERVVINSRVCEGCGDCGAKSACMSLRTVDTEYGPKTQVHQGSCNFDYFCLDGECPSFTLVKPARARRQGRWRRRGGTNGHAEAVSSTPAGPPGELGAPLACSTDGETVIRMPGIGGTGVVTVAQILGMAASLDGLTVHGLDQTGLSQKGGPVVSDLRISTRADPRPGRASAAGIDLLLALDPVVTATPDLLQGLSPARTVVIGSTTAAPTGDMIGHPDAAGLDVSALQAALDPRVCAQRSRWLDAEALAVRLVGNAASANVLLLGVAYQQGTLPVSAAAIEEAITENGTAVSANIAAFRWGRRVASDPATAAAPGPPSPSDITTRRAADLTAYQNAAYADRYLAVVARANACATTAFTTAVAENLYRLMAYKDEYEVARLHLGAEATAAAEQVGGPGAKVTLLLQPPMLRAIGLHSKIRIGPWARPALKMLAAGKWLRGKPYDPFGMAYVRRVERRLIADYIDVVDRLIADFDSIGAQTATRIANLPRTIRGYEHVKLAAVAKYQETLTNELTQCPTTAQPPPRR